MPRPISAEDYRVRASFEAQCQKLSDAAFADRIDRPLAYWALPADRRLPLALLGRTLRELVQLSYEDLAATPGIGLRKLGMLNTLLERASQDQTVLASPAPATESSADPPVAAPAASNQDGFDPALVSELAWEQWCQTVREHGLGQEKLGRLAPSLKELPTVIWHTPMSVYLDQRLGDIRRLKTHGEKRVRVILGVFHVVHQMLSSSGPHGPLAVRLLPRFVRPVEEWVTDVICRGDAPSSHSVRENLALPLLNQIEVDAGPIVLQLAENRLGIETPPQSVRLLSRRLGVTRARVYQLLEICNKVMEVRWPEGRLALSQLADRFVKSGVACEELTLFSAVRELFYPPGDESSDAQVAASVAKPPLEGNELAVAESQAISAVEQGV